MINSFNEIKNEKDREVYVELRNAFDRYVMATILHHERGETDHQYHECFTSALVKVKDRVKTVVSMKIDGESLEELKAELIKALDENAAMCEQHLMFMIALNEVIDSMEKKH
jgi:hypothetical protein